MRRNGSFLIGICAAALVFEGHASSSDVALSGRVVSPEATPVSGVVVRLVKAGIRTTTDAGGRWTLSGVAGVDDPRSMTNARNASHLVVLNRRLQVHLDDRDIAGRDRGGASETVDPHTSAAAARSQIAAPDTLEYSYDQKIFLRDTISQFNAAGIVSAYDTTWNASIIFGHLQDTRDGRSYRTVKIGSQVWMAQNLNFRTDSSFCYVGDTLNCSKFGRLYKWASALGLSDSCNSNRCASKVTDTIQGACPSGWHVANDAEWRKLTDTTFPAKTSAVKLRANSGLWNQNIGTDETGFRALPGGYINSDGSLCEPGDNNYWWTATEDYGNYAWGRTMYTGSTKVDRNFGDKNSIFSLRCIQN